MKVLIADDHRLMLSAIRAALEHVDDIEIVGEARLGTEVLPLLEQTRPDMVLMDVNMPGMDGVTCLDRVRAHHPNVKVVLISGWAEPERIQEALAHGASAYIVKTVNPVDLPAALRQVSEGSVFSGGPPAESAPQVVDGRATDLTEREVEILQALARGLSNKAIGREFWVTEQTVKFHLTNIYRKLGVANRTAAARYAHRHGLVQENRAAAARF